MHKDHLKKDISVMKLISYNLMFFIPFIMLYLISNYFSTAIGRILNTSPAITTQILMIILSLILFFILVPILRIRESVKGVRLAIFNFIIIGIVITIPSLLNGNNGIFMYTLIYLANFLFATVINCPDVIGITGNPEDWFKHKIQIMLFIVYFSIILLYIFGFAWLYTEMANDAENPNAFRYIGSETPDYITFTYHSVVTFSTTGYGDIAPASSGARLVTSIQTLLSIVINIVFIAAVLMYISFSANMLNNKTRDNEEKSQEVQKSNQENEIQRLKQLKEADRLDDPFYNPEKYPNYMSGKNNLKQ